MNIYDVWPSERIPCKVCGRQFIQESLEKHEPICLRNSKSKRKVFDTAKQRAEGTDITLKQIRKAQKTVVEKPKSNWKIKHEQFISNIRNARGVQHAIDHGDPLPPPPPPTIDPDYIQCQYCSRRFNEKAAERHIPYCKEKSKLKNMQPRPDATAKAKMEKRTQYQVPKPKAKTATSPGVMNPSPGGMSRTPGSGGPASTASSRNPGSGGPASTASSRNPAGQSGASRTTAGRTNPPASRGRTTGSYAASDYVDAPEPHGSKYKTPPFKTQYKGRNAVTPQELREGTVSSRSQSKSANMNKLSSTSRADVNGTGISSFSTRKYQDTAPCETEFENSRSSAYHSYSSNKHLSRSKFCHECGVMYPVTSAKFCSECGIRRLNIS